MNLFRCLFLDPNNLKAKGGSLQVANIEKDAKASRFPLERLADIPAFFASEIAAGHIPGAAVSIIHRGRSILHDAWGLRDPAHHDPMTTDCIFRINSMTKPIVSVLAMLMIEGGRLNLEDRLEDVLQPFPQLSVATAGTASAAAPSTRSITIRDLLRHTAGFTYGTSDGGAVGRLYRKAGLVSGRFDNAQFANRLLALPLIAEPGTTWEYSHATDLLGYILEVVGGSPLTYLLQKHVLDPLHMVDTHFDLATESIKQGRIAEAFVGDSPFGPHTSPINPRVSRPFASAGGGLLSTLNDYLRFCKFILGRGRLGERIFMSSDSFELMTRDHIGPETGIRRSPRSALPVNYGFGLGFAVRLAKQGGDFPGSPGDLYWSGISGTSFWIDPSLDLAVICLTQAPSRRDHIRKRLRQLVYEALNC